MSDPSRDRTGEGSLDFTQIKMAGSEPPPLTYFTGANGSQLGVRKYSADRAQAPLVVLLHGSGWHGLGYHSLAARIANANLADVLLPDLRGHGPNPERRGDIDYIGQLEDDLHALIEAQRSPGQKVVMAGHSSGGGLAIRYAGGQFGGDLDGAILLAPFLKHDAPTTRPASGGWAQARVRRIIGLSMLNTVGITALNHLKIVDFAFPKAVLEGPLGHTATRAYSYTMNRSYAPRSDYLGDVARLPKFLLVVGRDDEAFVADAYEGTLSAVNAKGQYVLLTLSRTWMWPTRMRLSKLSKPIWRHFKTGITGAVRASKRPHIT
ncbi:MAG: alpha/beta fold hydrolase [Pseudomonadota bacterium]